jgi:hypothetical protein
MQLQVQLVHAGGDRLVVLVTGWHGDHCLGLGYERVEMQFLSDVFVPCPVCESRRFKPEVLAITWVGYRLPWFLGGAVNPGPAAADAAVRASRARRPLVWAAAMPLPWANCNALWSSSKTSLRPQADPRAD